MSRVGRLLLWAKAPRSLRHFNALCRTPVQAQDRLLRQILETNADTEFGRYERQVDAVGGKLVIDGKPLVYLSERDPEQLPWAELEVGCLELAAPAPVLDDHRGREYGAAHGPCAPQRTHREAGPAPARVVEMLRELANALNGPRPERYREGKAPDTPLPVVPGTTSWQARPKISSTGTSRAQVNTTG
jgi:hypothetical protein